MRRLASLAGAAMLLAALASPALAAQPVRVFDGGTGWGFTAPCTDAHWLVSTFTVNKEYDTFFFDANGDLTKLIVTGVAKVTVSADNGNSMDLNISGPGVFNFATGRVMFLGSGQYFTDYAHGLNLASSGTFHGTQTDLCPILYPELYP